MNAFLLKKPKNALRYAKNQWKTPWIKRPIFFPSHISNALIKFIQHLNPTENCSAKTNHSFDAWCRLCWVVRIYCKITGTQKTWLAQPRKLLPLLKADWAILKGAHKRIQGKWQPLWKVIKLEYLGRGVTQTRFAYITLQLGKLTVNDVPRMCFPVQWCSNNSQNLFSSDQ